MIRRVRLDSVAKLDRSQASEAQCASLPYVGLEHIEKETGTFTDDFDAAPDLTLKASKYIFSPRHILYGKLRPYLNKVARPDFGGVCTTEIIPILPDDEQLDRVYLWAILISHSFVQWASRSVSGANLPRLSPKLLAGYRIPLPPLPEQRRISCILAKADRLRRLRRVARGLSDTYPQSVFVEMFGDPVDRGCPWQTKRLSSISDIASGVTKGRRFGKRETVRLPYLRVANVQDGYLNLSEIKMIDALPSDLENLRLVPGDILMTEGGDFDKLGRGAMWKGQVEDCIHQNHIFRVRLNQSVVLPVYFAAVLLTQYTKSYFLKASKQTTNLATINKTQLSAFPVPVPPMLLQRKYAEAARRFERLVSQQLEAKRQADHLFDTLLHRAFSGDL